MESCIGTSSRDTAVATTRFQNHKTFIVVQYGLDGRLNVLHNLVIIVYPFMLMCASESF